MTDEDRLRSWLFRSLMFEADTDSFRRAGVRIGVDEREVEEQLLNESLDPFDLATRNDAPRAALRAVLDAVRALAEPDRGG